MHNSKLLRVNLCCSQEKLERVLIKENMGLVLSFIEADTHEGMEIDGKVRRSCQGKTEIGVVGRNAGGCRGEGESDTFIA